MRNVRCEIYENGEKVYDGVIPTSKFTFLSRNTDEKISKEGDVTHTQTSSCDERYNFGMDDVGKIIIEAAGADVKKVRSGIFELEGPVILRFVKEPSYGFDSGYGVDCTEFMDKNALKKQLEEQMKEQFRSTAKITETTSTTIDGVRIKNKVREKRVPDDEVQREYDELSETFVSTILNFEGKIYFHSKEDYDAAKKAKDKAAMSGKEMGYDISWYIPHAKKFEVTCR